MRVHPEGKQAASAADPEAGSKIQLNNQFSSNEPLFKRTNVCDSCKQARATFEKQDNKQFIHLDDPTYELSTEMGLIR